MKEPKKHHFLPQFYLEQFKIVPQSGKYFHIYQIDKSATPKSRKPAIKDTGCITDYHTLDFPDQEKDRQRIETILSKLETEHAELVKEICNTNQISEEAKPRLADFVTTMRFRVPAFKEYIEKSLEGVVEATAKTLMYQKKLPPPPKELEELFKRQGYNCIKVKIFNWKILQYMLDMAFNSENVAILRQMKCKLLIAPPKCDFITGDSPVSIYHHNYAAIRPYGVGLAFKDVEVTFPISKRYLVKFTWNGTEESVELQKDQVTEYNRRTIIMANKYIFSPETSQHLIQQISKFHDIQAGYDLSNMWYGNGAAHIARFIPVTN